MQKFHLTIIIITLLAAATWVYSFLYVPPYLLTAHGGLNLRGLFLFTASFLVTVTGIFCLLTYPFRRWYDPFTSPRHATRVGIRQGIILSGALIFLMFLSIARMLNPLTLIFSVLTAFSLEYFFR